VAGLSTNKSSAGNNNSNWHGSKRNLLGSNNNSNWHGSKRNLLGSSNNRCRMEVA